MINCKTLIIFTTIFLLSAESRPFGDLLRSLISGHLFHPHTRIIDHHHYYTDDIHRRNDHVHPPHYYHHEIYPLPPHGELLHRVHNDNQHAVICCRVNPLQPYYKNPPSPGGHQVEGHVEHYGHLEGVNHDQYHVSGLHTSVIYNGQGSISGHESLPHHHHVVDCNKHHQKEHDDKHHDDKHHDDKHHDDKHHDDKHNDDKHYDDKHHDDKHHDDKHHDDKHHEDHKGHDHDKHHEEHDDKHHEDHKGHDHDKHHEEHDDKHNDDKHHEDHSVEHHAGQSEEHHHNKNHEDQDEHHGDHDSDEHHNDDEHHEENTSATDESKIDEKPSYEVFENVSDVPEESFTKSNVNGINKKTEENIVL